jgi:uncharacterized protein YceK
MNKKLIIIFCISLLSGCATSLTYTASDLGSPEQNLSNGEATTHVLSKIVEGFSLTFLNL